MIAGEIRRTPAVNRRADVLSCADDNGEHDKERNRVAVIQPVDDVVIVTSVQLDDARHRREQVVNHFGCSCCARRDVESESFAGSNPVGLTR
jgi:hypothetical protein